MAEAVGAERERAGRGGWLPARAVAPVLAAGGLDGAVRAGLAAGAPPLRLVLRGPFLNRWAGFGDGGQAWVAPGTAHLAVDGELAAVASPDGRYYAVGVLDRSGGRVRVWSDWDAPPGEAQRELCCCGAPVLLGPVLEVATKRGRAASAVADSEAVAREAAGLAEAIDAELGALNANARVASPVPIPFLEAMRGAVGAVALLLLAEVWAAPQAHTAVAVLAQALS